MAVLTAIAVPQMLAGLDHFRTLGAARYLSTRFYQARMDAAARTTDTAIRFVRAGDSYEYATIMDGNRNGIRSADIARGVDREFQAKERLRDKFPGVDFGTLPGLPAVEGSESAPGADPVRLGSSNMVTFTAGGMSSPGSLYVLGPRNTQFVVRILGETGKIRILRFDRRGGTWRPL